MLCEHGYTKFWDCPYCPPIHELFVNEPDHWNEDQLKACGCDLCRARLLALRGLTLTRRYEDGGLVGDPGTASVDVLDNDELVRGDEKPQGDVE